MSRKSIYSICFKLMDTGAGPVMVYIVDDLPDEVLQYHFDMAMDKDDYEYAQAVTIEANNRRIRIKT